MRIGLSEPDKEWLNGMVDVNELKQAAPSILLAVILFIGILCLYPHTPLYRNLKYPYIVRIQNPPEITMSPGYMRFLEQVNDVWEQR